MALVSKPLWSEGMLIRPQHFQQYDRWIEHVLEGRVAGLHAFGWGLRSLSLSTELLPLGRFGVAEIRAVLPDGTVLASGGYAALEARAIPPNTKNALVKIAIPVRAGDGAEIGGDGLLRRHESFEQMVRDTTAPDRGAVDLRVARLLPRLIIEGEREDDLITLPIARIRELDATGAIILDENYIPPCVDFHVSQRLVRIVNEIRSLLRSRAEALAGRADPAQATAESGGLVDLLILSIVNGSEAVFDHFAAAGLHPEEVYRASVELAGQLSTFTRTRRRAADFPPYRHMDAETAFAPVLDQLRQLLATLVERNAIALPLQDRGYGIRLSTVTDRTLFQDCRFVLIAVASMPSETLRSQLPVHMKIGSVEQIRDLVNLQLPGIPARAMPAAPRELPFLQGAVYFELDQSVELWRGLTRSAAIAFHISGEYPDLHLEFWAIRGKRP